MTRKLKALGLALMAFLAISVVATAAALTSDNALPAAITGGAITTVGIAGLGIARVRTDRRRGAQQLSSRHNDHNLGNRIYVDDQRFAIAQDSRAHKSQRFALHTREARTFHHPLFSEKGEALRVSQMITTPAAAL